LCTIIAVVFDTGESFEPKFYFNLCLFQCGGPELSVPAGLTLSGEHSQRDLVVDFVKLDFVAWILEMDWYIVQSVQPLENGVQLKMAM
jgi:hypothetical protein